MTCSTAGTAVNLLKEDLFVRVLGLILRVFSFVFHALLIVFALAASVLAWTSGSTLEVSILPWTGATLMKWLFFSGLAGAVIALLALKRIVPVLFLLWNIAVLVTLVRGFFFSSYGYGLGGGSITMALYYTLGAFVAAVGSWLQMRPASAEVRRRQAAIA
jgi:hypothetical protein